MYASDSNKYPIKKCCQKAANLNSGTNYLGVSFETLLYSSQKVYVKCNATNVLCMCLISAICTNCRKANSKWVRSDEVQGTVNSVNETTER